MKRMLVLLVLIALAANSPALAQQFYSPPLAYGLSVGGAQGDNLGSDKWVPQYRGYIQYRILTHHFLGQAGLGYTELNASGVNGYTANILIFDNRFLYIPFSLANVNPYLFAGVGVTKNLDVNQKYLPMIPFGIGVQTRLSDTVMLQVNGGYNLSLSDKLDRIERTSSSTNNFTNGKQDGFFSFLIGLTFAKPDPMADTDKDGLTNKDEKALGTDPKNPDTDGDGLSDGDEVHKYRTDPLKADTDGDGLNDGEEVNRYRTDPLKADTDGDGLKDGEEVNRYRTDPLKADTDGDGLNDGPEVNQYRTDPLNPDTDGDALNDGAEVNRYRSDPLKVDTDTGGIQDGAEVTRGTDPLDSRDDYPMVVIERGSKPVPFQQGYYVILRGVNFEFDQSSLSKLSIEILDIAYQSLAANPSVRIQIAGYADSIGTEEYNQKLSERRADAVKSWLVKKGIAANRMTTIGRGEVEPIAKNNTEVGRAANRCIVFVVQL